MGPTNLRVVMAFLALIVWAASLASSAQAQPSSLRSRRVLAQEKPGLVQALSARGLRWGAPVFLRVFKQEKSLELWVKGPADRFMLFRSYSICSYSGDLGPKTREGDFQSPEGLYRVTAGRLNPFSHFHLSFNLGFPNRYERAQGWTGSLLMVHGGCASIGCYAMTNAGIEEIYLLVEAALHNGQPAVPVHAFPFRLTEGKLNHHRDSKWASFWRALQPAYDAFEKTHRPPKVRVRGGQYVISER